MPLTTDFLERIRASFLQLADYVPALAGALIVLFAGYLLAKLIERGTDRLLDRMGRIEHDRTESRIDRCADDQLVDRPIVLRALRILEIIGE